MPRKPIYWRRKTRRQLAKLVGELRSARGEERIRLLEAMVPAVVQFMHWTCTANQLEELYALGLTNPLQRELFSDR